MKSEIASHREETEEAISLGNEIRVLNIPFH
jgi:hypothetical protein